MSALQLLPSTTDDFILDHLSAGDMMRFAKTCAYAHASVQSYIRRKFKFASLLGRWFTEENSTRLRVIMAETGAIISGSVALQFFNRERYPFSDLDLYVKCSQASYIVRFLESAGYEFVPKSGALQFQTWQQAVRKAANDGHSFASGLSASTVTGYYIGNAVLDFYNYQTRAKVQVIVSGRAATENVLQFHSSVVMNIITHEKAYCLFPKATLDHRVSIAFTHTTNGYHGCRVDRSPHQALVYRKYENRGYVFKNAATVDHHFHLTSNHRYIGDSFSWVVPLTPIRDDLPHSNIEVNSFYFTLCNMDALHIDFRHFALPYLRHDYIVSPFDATFITRRLASWAGLSLSDHDLKSRLLTHRKNWEEKF